MSKIKLIQSLPNCGKSTCVENITNNNVLDLIVIDTDNFIYDYNDKSDMIDVLNGIFASVEGASNSNVVIFTNLHLLKNAVEKYGKEEVKKFLNDNSIEYIITIPMLGSSFKEKFFNTGDKTFTRETLFNWYLDYIKFYCFSDFNNLFEKYQQTEYLTDCFMDFVIGGNYVK